uniref:TauD/TfdA-like domain-containing protein n=1 Tax=viral metagenome TaxID=1070528 RepID=A0A6C0ESY4_9ZZZZ
MEESHIIELTNDEILVMKELAMNISENPSIAPDLYCLQVKCASHRLPERIRILLQNFADNGSNTGFLLIRRIPIDELPTTPENNNCKIGEQTTLAKIQSIFVSVISNMIAYEAEGYGRLFQDVIPVKSMEKNQTSISSSVELEIHTEQAFSKLRPDILSLACLRGNTNAYTYILPVKSIINNVTDTELKMLKMPLWNTGVDLSFKLNGHEFIEGDIRGPMSIIRGYKDKRLENEDPRLVIEDPLLVFDQDLMTGITEESNKMIHKIVDIYYKHRFSHNLTPGEIVFIDNNRAVHGRSPFVPNYDGLDRFLVRCFGVYNYEYSAYARENGGRVVSAIYS